MKISKMSNKQLKEEYTAAYDAVYGICGYGTSEVLWLENLERELDKRGLKIKRE